MNGKRARRNAAWTPGIRIAVNRWSIAVVTLLAFLTAGCSGNGGEAAAVRGADFCPSWSPDGRFVAFARAYETAGRLQWDAHVVGAAGRSARRLTDTPEDEGVLGWRSQLVVFDRGNEVFAVPPTERAPEQRIGDLPPANLRVLSPDGAWLAFTVERPDGIHSDVFVRRLAGGERWALPRSYVHGGLPQWSADGRRLAYADGDETFRVVTRNGRTLGRVAGNFPVWSPDGKMIAYRVLDETNTRAVRVYDVTNRVSSELLARDTDDELAWSPDSRTVLYGGRGGIWAARVGGSRSRRLFMRGPYFMCLTFSPDGRRIAFLRLTSGGGALTPPAQDLVLANADGTARSLVGP